MKSMKSIMLIVTVPKRQMRIKKKIQKNLVDINKKYSENLRNIFKVEAKIAEMTSGNANCGDNVLYLMDKNLLSLNPIS